MNTKYETVKLNMRTCVGKSENAKMVQEDLKLTL
ncbi:hypothetical protein SAMN05428964_102544 [Thalassospira xiamenensis]|uniref:Uncharacterized protein n=1 Tax=Thalassospira xiamenensis TaxID=220697 RepID=A0A285T944_9PROT|nr:hypothetical protein SAMN05428964_102544 [Thalassospira xiamenensis]